MMHSLGCSCRTHWMELFGGYLYLGALAPLGNFVQLLYWHDQCTEVGLPAEAPSGSIHVACLTATVTKLQQCSWGRMQA